MIRGTAAQFKFKLPCIEGELEWATIRFWQNGTLDALGNPLSITKSKDHCSFPENPYELCVTLSPNETARFSDKTKAMVQLRAKPIGGNVFGTQERLITVYPMNDDLIMDDDDVLPESNDNGLIILDGSRIT